MDTSGQSKPYASAVGKIEDNVKRTKKVIIISQKNKVLNILKSGILNLAM